jgi:ketosteroid isomerase-like protein
MSSLLSIKGIHMRNLALLVTLATLGAAPPYHSPPNADQAAVIAQEKAWSNAFLAHDLRKLSAIISDDFVGIDGRGVLSTKADELAEAAPPKPGDTGPQLVREEYSDAKVRFYGRTAVLTDTNSATFASSSSTKVIRYRRTTVWIKTPTGWRCVSFHGSRIMDKPA